LVGNGREAHKQMLKREGGNGRRVSAGGGGGGSKAGYDRWDKPAGAAGGCRQMTGDGMQQIRGRRIIKRRGGGGTGGKWGPLGLQKKNYRAIQTGAASAPKGTKAPKKS